MSPHATSDSDSLIFKTKAGQRGALLSLLRLEDADDPLTYGTAPVAEDRNPQQHRCFTFFIHLFSFRGSVLTYLLTYSMEQSPS